MEILKKICSVLLTVLFIGCIIGFIAELIQLFDAYTSLTGWTTERQYEILPILIGFGIGAIVFYFLKRIIKKQK